MKKPCYIVLGAPRSGTSLLASILNEMGIFMGYNFLPADDANPNGYFEDQTFLGLNKGILINLNMDWYSFPPPKIIRQLLITLSDDIIKSAKQLIKTREVLDVPWGWKDPRNTILCQFYHRLIAKPKYIIIQRDIEDVVKSLLRVHGKDEQFWINLVLQYDSHILAFYTSTKVKPGQFHFIHYEDICKSPYIEIIRLAKFVNINPDDDMLFRCKSLIKSSQALEKPITAPP